MAQDYTEFPSTEPILASHTKIIDNFKASRSLNSGTSFPTTDLYNGTPCWRTDLDELYIYDGISAWTKFDASALANTPNIPTGNIAATNVQAAINELDAEKEPASPLLTDAVATNTIGRKNLIINGDMRIDQRNAGAEVSPAITNTYYLDRILAASTTASKFKIGQNAGAVTPPDNFTNYLGVTSISAYTPLASDFFQVKQNIEGYNASSLGYGKASAKTATLSFWVRSSLTGDFGVVLSWGSVNGNERGYPVLYTINTANTWEYKTITIAGDTTDSASGQDVGSRVGLQVRFSLGGGADNAGTSGAWATGNLQSVTGGTSVVSTNGATFYITGIQLERGSVATDFEYRSIGEELALCKRYYEISNLEYYRTIYSATSTAGEVLATITFAVSKRVNPSIEYTGATATNISFTQAGVNLQLATNPPNNGLNSTTVTADAEL